VGASPSCRLTSLVSYEPFLGRRIVSPGLLLSLGVVFSEGGAVFKGLGRALVGR
jgi:hypothetical protein